MSLVTIKASVVGELRIHSGANSYSPSEARDMAFQLQHMADTADRLPAQHERHVNLMAYCPLCVFEAGDQPDRLTWNEPNTEEQE